MTQEPTADRRLRERESMDHITMLKDIWGPMERRESYDLQPFFDSLDDDVVFATSLGDLHGKQALMHYFTRSSELLEAHPFTKPLEFSAMVIVS